MYMSLILLTSLLVVYLLAAYILVERLFDYVPLVVPAPYAIALNPVIRLGEWVAKISVIVYHHGTFSGSVSKSFI